MNDFNLDVGKSSASNRDLWTLGGLAASMPLAAGVLFVPLTLVANHQL